MRPGPDMLAASTGRTISVIGFVKAPGRYSYREGMRVEDALDEAGGYDTCILCQRMWEELGRCPTYEIPPFLRRAGRHLRLPWGRAEWMQFALEPNDEIDFRHYGASR